MTEVFIRPPLHCVCVWQGEEGPPSLEYIKAKDLFPQKELVKEDESLQVSRNSFHQLPLESTAPSALTSSCMSATRSWRKVRAWHSWDYDLISRPGSWCSALKHHCVECDCQDITTRVTTQQARCQTLKKRWWHWPRRAFFIYFFYGIALPISVQYTKLIKQLGGKQNICILIKAPPSLCR